MKSARALRSVPMPRVYTRGSATARVVRRSADPARRQKMLRLLAELLDKPATPGEGERR